MLDINLDMLIGITLVYMYATCGSLSNAYKLFDGLRFLNVGADHKDLHEGMLVHAEIMSYTRQDGEVFCS